MKKFLMLIGVCSAVLTRAADEALPASNPSNPNRATAAASPAAAPTPVTPSSAELQAIQSKLAELKAAIAALKAAQADDDLIVDAEANSWVVENILRVPGAFISQDVLDRCVPILEAGLRRASEIKAGTAKWPRLKGRVNRAHRSSVDGTAQPYQLTIPQSYDPAKPIPLYLYLHGRSPHNPDLGHTWVGGDDQPTERNAGGAEEPGYIRVNAFGRGNNSYRFAGETDVLEVIASVRQRYNIDPDRILLAGFSMGGAGSWQIGLRMPDLFCGLEINAGVIGNRLELDGVNPAQRAYTSLYGMTVPHALAVANVPLVAFAGENDSQLAASINIREQLVREGFTINQTGPHVWTGRDINALFLVNPDLGHAHPTGETKQRRDDFTNGNFTRGRVVPDRVRFVTYTTRYNQSYWVTIDGLQQHFARATIDAERDAAKTNYTIITSNISRLLLSDTTAARRITIDGQTLNVRPAPTLLLVRDHERWQVGRADANTDTALRKRHKLQGPINDAFFESFLCVAPTGQPFHALAAERAQQEQQRFAAMFTRDFCGEARTKNDTEITADDIANHNLILFGDPGSNQLLARIVSRLPIRWTRDSIIVGDKTYSAAEHIPVLIYPNPLNPQRYVVINSGLFIPGRGASGLGDYAVFQLTPQSGGSANATIVAEGVFDESWQLAKTEYSR